MAEQISSNIDQNQDKIFESALSMRQKTNTIERLVKKNCRM